MIKRYETDPDDGILYEQSDGYVVCYEDHIAVARELKSRLESLEKDAARYRWLKADGEDVDVVRYRSDLFNFELGDELDEAIDTAMQANKGE